MHVNNLRKYFLETLVELLGIKTGLAISIEKAVTLLTGENKKDAWWEGPFEQPLMLEAGEVERVFVLLLHAVGKIGDAVGRSQLVFYFCRDHKIEFSDAWLEMLTDPEDSGWPFEEPFQGLMNSISFVQASIHAHLDDGKPLPDVLVRLEGFSELVEQFSLRSIMHRNMPVNRTWDGIVPLDHLFASEDGPADTNTFFDQRFIDYLSVQHSDLSSIHWRQFEYLTGEYFRRNGYEVKIGPGRADGGVDVTAIKKSTAVGPEMIVIQCKRYAENNLVKITDVQAFWTVATDLNATKALIATTSHYPAGVTKWCEAKQYRLTPVEGDNVRNWIDEMKSTARATGTPASSVQ